ncbi:MAG: tetratricopeptide repeat protein, partial [Candidatus Cloacimonetes bacterium]|nr:tetratricopeptide repeat protein [Candidatus Cloacimonadota bacterium]
MENLVDNILSKFATKNHTIVNTITDKLKTGSSKIVEVIGEAGSGKSYIFNKLNEKMQLEQADYRVYIPYVFRYNQLREIIRLICTISLDDYDNYIEEAAAHGIANRFDFFNFLTQHLNKQNLFRIKNIIIYESHYLDDYTLDFLRYLVEYFTDENINFVIFTRKETFGMSDKIYIKKADIADIKQILRDFSQDDKKEFIMESEVISKISKGNLFIIGYLLNFFLDKNKELDFTSYLEKSLTVKKILHEKITQLSDEETRLLYTILLLDTETHPLDQLIADNDIRLRSLLDKRLIFKFDDRYYVKKVVSLKEHFFALPKAQKKKLSKPIIELHEPLRNDLTIMLDEAQEEMILAEQVYLRKINDFNGLREIYQILLSREKLPEKKVIYLKELGLSNRKLGKQDAATETFRQALKICMDNSLPAEEIVFHLADNLYSKNSSNFALEIIKKYSPDSIDLEWKCKILILKSEIMMDMEEFDEAMEVLDEAYNLSDDLRDPQARYGIKARARKIKGLIHYYSNEWKKAEIEFGEAEKFYQKKQDKKGLAAIYNNLGGLSMLQGEWDKTEKYYLQSLDLEKKLFSLSGISGCYSNLGYLFEDKSDYKKSLYYLNEALKIQKLLDDRDVITSIYINIGVTYMDNGEYKKAEQAFNNLLEIALKYNLYRNVIAAFNNLGALYFKSGEWNRATDYYERAIKKSQDHNFLEGISKSYNNLGELYEKRREYLLAFECYTKCEELLPKISDEFLKAELYGNLGSVLTCLHRFKEAYGYLVESYEYFKNLNARDKIIEGAQKQAFYFIQTRNYESANYYLDIANKMAEELHNDYQIGKVFFLRSILEKSKPDIAMALLKKAIEKFIKTNNNFDLAMANYEFALHLYDKEEWEQSLEILKDNKKLIKTFGAIKFLEKNDILIQKINQKFSVEMKESRQQESLLNNFYEITQELNTISDFDILLETALDKLVAFSDADGGIFCLYQNQLVKDSWEYIILSNLTNDAEDFPMLMKLIQESFTDNKSLSHKQPHFASEYNHIITYPLSVRNNIKGVICLFTKHGSHYFTEKMYNLISALSNQIIVIVENISYANLQKSHAVIREELATSGGFSNIIGKSPKIQAIFSIIDKIKDAPTTVLLQGSSGTGKELIARAIHFNSNRR